MNKIKFLSIVLSAALVGGMTTSCVGDLDVTPIDPNTVLPEDVLSTQDAYTALLAKCYQGLAVSSSSGPSGGPDIDGVDGGYGQYMRAVVNLQELTTDVMTCCWNDAGLPDMHNLTWTSSNNFVLSMYYRIFYQVSLCNEFIRRSNAAAIDGYTKKDSYIAEARALRLFSYYHAIDMFGNVPFFTEENSVGANAPAQIMRADLFDWCVAEAQALLEDANLAEARQNEYGRVDKGFVRMLLAKFYLNAEVWKGQAMYAECAKECQILMRDYKLADNYAELFCADNHRHTANTTYNGNEIIFAVPQDGISIQSYGATNFIVFACTGGDMDLTKMGISSGWGGLTLTGTLTSKFEENDARAMFYKDGLDQYINDMYSFKDSGWKSMKFTNVNHDGTPAQADGFVDTDFPVFRTADVYLMFAECAARGAADKVAGEQYLNAVRARAGVGAIALTAENVLDERARELYMEGHRRQDLVRYGLFTSGNYLWEYKGGVKEGSAVADHFNLFPLTSGDVNANGNLTQNPGY